MKQLRDRGFTIVELLIVIVIIAILATITIVAYNGITARAHTSASQAAAQNFANKAEAYNAEIGSYPTKFSDLSGASADKSYNLPATALTFKAAALAAPGTSDPDDRISVQQCPATGTPIGLKIFYWNYQASTPAVATMSVGNVSGSCATGYMPASGGA